MLLELESKYGLLFSYEAAAIEGLTVTPPKGRKKLDTFLNNLLETTNLDFEITQQRYVILSLKAPPKVTPNYSILCGTILDQQSQTPLPFANVYLKNTRNGVSTNEQGKFKFKAVLQAGDSLVFSYVGYQEQIYAAKEFITTRCPEITLSIQEMSEDFVVITDYLTDGISLHNNGAYTVLRPDRMKPLPGQAEPEVLNAIQFLPGIVSPDGSASNISIRGGTADQNLILWEGIPIYHAAHYFGMISAFNPYIIKQVSVYRGGFGVEYGGRISGLIDLKSDDHTTKSSSFGIGSNFLNAYTNGSVSLIPEKATIVYSFRRSISDAWRSPTFNNITRRIQQSVLLDMPILNQIPKSINIQDAVNFLDTNIKGSFKISPKDEVQVAWFLGSNDFKAVIEDTKVDEIQSDTLMLDNSGLSLSWKHQWMDNFSTKVLAVKSNYQYDYDYQTIRMGASARNTFGQKKSSIKEQQLHITNEYQSREKHTFKLGYQLTDYDVDFLITKAAQNNPNSSSITSKVHTGYASFNTAPEKKVGFDLGLRYNYFEKEKRAYVEPRLRLWYNWSKDLNVYFNAGKYYQFLSQIIEIQGDRSSIETPVWVLAGEREVPVLNSSQALLGMTYRKKSWFLDIQAYYKNINGLTSLAINFDENIGDRFHLGSARIRGLDILLKKRWGNYNAWISYSLSRSDHSFDTFFDREFPASIDQRQVLSFANLWTFGNFDCSLGWRLSSGKPFSLRRNYDVRIINEPNSPDEEVIRPLVNEFNTERLPFEHQMDASVTYTLRPKNVAKWKAVFGLSFFNIYHQRNIFKRSFFIQNLPDQEPRIKFRDQINVGFTPNIVARLEW